MIVSVYVINGGMTKLGGKTFDSIDALKAYMMLMAIDYVYIIKQKKTPQSAILRNLDIHFVKITADE
jgi:hypothetical protein